MTKNSYALYCRVTFLIVLGLAIVFTNAFGQQTDEAGKVTVHKLIKYDLSIPLRDMAPAPRQSGIKRVHPVKPIPHSSSSGKADGAAQLSAVPSINAPSVTSQFNGIGSNNGYTVQSAPPDTNGDVSATQYVQTVNTDIAVFNKSTGAYLLNPEPINTLWSGFGGGCQTNNDGDPTVTYDQIANRWIVTQFSVSTTPYLQCVAVSQTSDATGSWYRFSYSFGTSFDDYPKLGMMVDASNTAGGAYYQTFNLFNSAGTSFLGADICAYNRAALLAGSANTIVCYNAGTTYGGLLAADLDGSTVAPSGSPEFVLAVDAPTTSSNLVYWTVTPNFTNSTMAHTGPTTLAVSSYTEACNGGTCVPQSGTTQQLDSLADRMMNRLQYRNFGGTIKMVASHSVTVGSSSAVRWYQFNVSGSTISVAQQASFSPDTTYRWMPSIAMDGSQDIAVGYSTSSSSLHPGIAYTGRVPTDAANTMQAETVAFTGAGSQTGSSLSRWGDYSNMAVDPSDDCTFWYTTEYIPSNGAFNWATRIVSFKFPGCGGSPTPDFSLSASPSSLTINQGASGNSTITVTSINGFNSAVSLSASGLPSGVTASFSPTSVTPPANGSSPSTLTLTASASATTGTVTVTITGTSGASHTTTISLTVNPSGGGSGITNGGFETGNLTGWTGTGASETVTTGAARSGTYGNMDGLTTPTNGDSTVTQTFTVPSAGGNVSFWYKMTCPDSVTYDWATATLKDNTTGTTTTLLAKTCTTNAWTQVTSAALTAGHSMTLTLTSHDDNYASDPSYTYFDDVAISGSTDTTAPTTSITAPANGATVASTITVSASASDNVGVTKVEFYIDSVLKNTDTTSPYSFSWDTTSVANGNHTIFSKAYDAANNVGTSATITVNVNNVSVPALTAAYSATYKAPACGSGGKSCDTGASLINGRGTMSGGVESNAPNTINSSCADGNSGTYHSDESIDAMKVATNDSSALAAGKAVTITFTTYCYSSADHLDIYYTANASSPSWTFIATQNCTAAGVKTFTQTYTLPTGATQAVRGTFRYNGSASACGTNSGYDDHDDLVFGVQ